MTTAEMEALSKKHQAELKGYLPAEGSYFQLSSGEGATQLFQRRGQSIVGLGFEYPQDWQGRTIGSWQKRQTSAAISSLGLSNLPSDIADVRLREAIEQAGLQRIIQTDLGKFVSESQGFKPSGTLGALTSGFDINAFNQQMVAATPSNLATMTGEEYLAAGYSGGQPPATPTPISPITPEAIAPENSLAGIRSVFGAGWTPSPAFTPALQAKGIYGAVRIAGTNEVYTLGTGGTKETAESFLQKFGTSNQKGIVGEITKEQATKLGITDKGQTPVAPGTPGAITSDALAQTNQIDLSTAGGGGTTYTADTAIASLEEYLKLQESLKSQAEKDREKKVDDLTTQIETLLGETGGKGAAQLAVEEAEGVSAKQQAVDDANANLQIKLAEINSLTASFNLENQIVEGKPITLARMQGQQAQNYKMYLAQKNLLTSEATLLQAQALGLQGKLDSAQKAADRAVDLKYSDIETRLKNQLALLELLEGQLDKDEQKRADALDYFLTQQKTALADQKATEKANYTTLLSQMNQYPDAGIQLTDTLEQANAKITANSAIYRQQTRLADTTPGPSPTPTPEGVNPQVDALARSYLRGESLGSLSGSLRGQVLTRAEEIQRSPGFKEQVKVEIRGDIQEAINRKDYTVREDIINRLQPIYTELTLDEIAAEVYGMIPDEPEPEVREGFFERLFGGLIPR